MYQLQYHKKLTPEIWSKYGSGKQILMIANELNRLINVLKNGLGGEEFHRTIEKIFELIDLSATTGRKNLKLELLRLRDLLAEIYIEGKSSNEKLDKLYRVLLSLDKESAMLL